MGQKIIYKILMLITVAVLQVYLFDRIPQQPYVHITFYMAYVVLLSSDTNKLFLLLTSALLGAAVDIMSGIPGINLISITAAAYLRPFILSAIAGKEKVTTDFVPSVYNLGFARFLLYSASLVFINSLIVIICESGALFLANGRMFVSLLTNFVSTTILILLLQYLTVRKPKSRW